jgi:hypothetical protein
VRSPVVIHVMKEVLLPSFADQHDEVGKYHERDDADEDEVEREKTDTGRILGHDQTEWMFATIPLVYEINAKKVSSSIIYGFTTANARRRTSPPSA